jgi:oligoribonuclease
MTVKPDHLIWIDLEMTGLDPAIDRILEIATIVTDSQLQVVAEGPNLVIHQPEIILESMNEWCVKTHTATGLVQRIRDSRITEIRAEAETLSFLQQYVTENTSPICGNSVWQDRRFLDRYMPQLAQFFHYRQLDVSTLKVLAGHWAPNLLKEFTKKNTHLALDDIRESIAELKYYKDHFIKSI